MSGTRSNIMGKATPSSEDDSQSASASSSTTSTTTTTTTTTSINQMHNLLQAHSIQQQSMQERRKRRKSTSKQGKKSSTPRTPVDPTSASNVFRLWHLLVYYGWKAPWGKFYQMVDRIILICSEYTKTVVREMLLLLGQLFNSIIIFGMFIFYEPVHYSTSAMFQPSVNLVENANQTLMVESSGSGASSPQRTEIPSMATKEDTTAVLAEDRKNRARNADVNDHDRVSQHALERRGSSLSIRRRENNLTQVLKRALESAEGGIQSPALMDDEMDDDDEMYPTSSNVDSLSDAGSWLLEDEQQDLLLTSTESMSDLTGHSPKFNSMENVLESSTEPYLDVDDGNRGSSSTSSISGPKRFPFNLLTLLYNGVTRTLKIIGFWYGLARKVFRLLMSSPFLFRKPYLESTVSPNKRGLLGKTRERRGSTPIIGVAADRVHRKEKVTSGLFEDILTAQFQFIDEISVASMYVARLWIPSALKQIVTAFRLFHPKNFISREGIDQRTIGQLIRDEGYPYEKVKVVTKDGYILRMDRIPNPKSSKVIFLQHGILDSAFAWVAQGADCSIAFRAHYEGYDVWMGNFRGYGPSLRTSHKLTGSAYWDFSFNEHAFFDVRAFVEKIVEVKRRELGCPHRVPSSKHNDSNNDMKGDNEKLLLQWDKKNMTITAIAHSMGGASILAYLVNQSIQRRPHHLDGSILLSPAGVHENFPFILDVLSRIFLPLIPSVIPLYYAGLTSVTNKILLSKLFQDINSHPAMRSLFAALTSLSLLGGQVKTSPFQRIHNMWMHTFNGTSIKVLKHFSQLSRSQKFQAFDYGEKGNVDHYNSKEPLNFLENYHLIDIPITIVYGEDDRVIPAENVLRHYVALQTFHPRNIKLKRYGRIGHLDLCHGANEQLIQYVLGSLKHAEGKRRSAKRFRRESSRRSIPVLRPPPK